MAKKASSRQNAIITLSDHNKNEIEEIKRDKEKSIEDFEAKKIGKYKQAYTYEHSYVHTIIRTVDKNKLIFDQAFSFI